MPQVIGAIILSFFSISATAGFTIAGVTITYASIIGATIIAAASYALSAALTPSLPSARASDGQLTLQQPIPWRRRIYGRAKVGGYFIFWDSVSGTFYHLIALASHELDAIEENWVGDRRVVLDGSGFVVAVDYPPGANPNQFNPGGVTNIIRIETDLGAPGKVANGTLIAAWPGVWSSQHIGIGIADALIVQKSVKQQDFSTVYPGGAQPYRAVVRGAKIKDPRTGTVAWSDNAAAVVRDYLTSSDGWRIDPSFFDGGLGLPITQAACDICDELVALKSGGTEKRYRIWGFYEFGEEPRAVLNRFMAACGGWLQPQKDGTIGIKVGKWEAPDVTITSDHILSYDVQHFTAEFDAINEVRATFTWDQSDYQDTESVPWQDTADIARRGYIRSTTVDARHCPSYTQARRIQKIGAHEVLPEWTLNITTDAYGLLARNRRFIEIEIDELGLAIACRITSFVANLQTGVCTIGLSSFGSSAYDWDPNAEEGPAPPVPGDTSSEGLVEAPVSLTVTVQTHTVSGGVDGALCVVSTPAPTDRSDLTAKFEYQPSGGSTWTTIPPGTDSFQAQTGVLTNGTYNFRVSFLGPNSSQSTFVVVSGVVVNAQGSAPSPPTGLAAAYVPASPPYVQLDATSPNSVTFSALRFWANTVNSFGSATDVSGALFGSPNQPFSIQVSLASGLHYIWATAETADTPPVVSSPAGPVTVTVP